MSKPLRLLSMLFTSLGWLSLAVAVVLLAGLLALHAKSSDPYVIRSNSMQPTFSAGDLLVAKRTPADSIQVGDVITFYQPRLDAIVTHRVMQRSAGAEQSWLTKGDANDAADFEQVQPKDLRGKYWFSIPGAGYAAIVMSSPRGRVAIIAVPLILLLLGSGIAALEGRARLRRRRTTTLAA